MGDSVVSNRDGNHNNVYFDLIRFVAAIGIMFFHSNFAGWSWHPCMNGYVYVELFFILSGYFLASHFWEKRKKTQTKNYGEPLVVEYIIKKYTKYLYYSAIPTFIVYFSVCFHNKDSYPNVDSVLSLISTWFLETFYLRLDNLLNGPIWYLSAMLIIMPLISLLLRHDKNKNISVVLCFIAVYWIYSKYGSMNQTWTPYNWLRAAGGMSLGVVLRYFTERLQSVNPPKAVKGLLSGLQIFSVAFPFCYLYNNMGGYCIYIFCSRYQYS